MEKEQSNIVFSVNNKMAIPLVMLLLLLLWLLKFTNKKLSEVKLARAPGPMGLPLVGNLLLLRGGSPYTRLARLAAHYGPIMHLRLGCVPAIVLSDAALAREALHTNDKLLACRPPLESLQRLFYGRRQLAVFNSPCTAEGWHRTKTLYAHRLFSAHRIHTHSRPVIAQEVRRMLRELRDRNAAPVDVSSALRSLLENIISRILLGQPLSDLLLGVTTPHGPAPSFRHILRQFVVLFQSGVVGDFIPFLGFLDYPIKRAMDTWHSSFESLLESAIRNLELSGAEPEISSFVSELLAAKEFSRDKVKAVLMELLAAGIDTSSVTLDWAMAELLTNPHVLTKLQQEITKVVGQERLVTTTDLPNLPYLKAVIKETFRKHMPAPLLLPRISTQTCKLGGYDIPQGTRVFINAWAIANDPQTWPQPHKFMPERFCNMNLNEGKSEYNEFHLFPFGLGRRACPGKPLAMLITELVLSNVVHIFDWMLPQDHIFVDMSEKFGAVASRAQHLIAIPTLRIHHSSIFDHVEVENT